MAMAVRPTQSSGSVSGAIQNAGTDTFVDYTFSPPVDVSAFSSFFVGDMTPSNNGPEVFFQGIDESSGSHMQSYIAANSTGAPVDINMPGNNDLVGTIEDLSGGTISGNWGIRADTGNPTPTPTPTPTPPCSWSAGPDLPSVGVRMAGVYFPANGKFYAMGGRSSDPSAAISLIRLNMTRSPTRGPPSRPLTPTTM